MYKNKTNVMRILEREGISYRSHSYDPSDGKIDGEAVAHKLSQPVGQVFKTLVTTGSDKNHYVFVIPVAKELDLKAAARTVGTKSIEMLKVSELLATTGYIRGGCSPIGMKKSFTTVVDESCLCQPSIYVSAGKIGRQVELSPEDLIRIAGASVAAICR